MAGTPALEQARPALPMPPPKDPRLVLARDPAAARRPTKARAKAPRLVEAKARALALARRPSQAQTRALASALGFLPPATTRGLQAPSGRPAPAMDPHPRKQPSGSPAAAREARASPSGEHGWSSCPPRYPLRAPIATVN